MKFPSVKHDIPELFQEIIKTDNTHRGNLFNRVTEISLFKETSSRRNQLLEAANNIYGSKKGQQDGPVLA